jgi:hypothetical protein
MNSHVDEPTLIYPVHNFPSDKITGIAKTLLKKILIEYFFKEKKEYFLKIIPRTCFRCKIFLLLESLFSSKAEVANS